MAALVISDDVLRQRIADGARLAEIGREQGVHWTTVGRRCKQLGIAVPLARGQRPKIASSLIAAVILRLRSGDTATAIADDLGVSPSTIYSALNRHCFVLRGGVVHHDAGAWAPGRHRSSMRRFAQLDEIERKIDRLRAERRQAGPS